MLCTQAHNVITRRTVSNACDKSMAIMQGHVSIVHCWDKCHIMQGHVSIVHRWCDDQRQIAFPLHELNFGKLRHEMRNVGNLVLDAHATNCNSCANYSLPFFLNGVHADSKLWSLIHRKLRCVGLDVQQMDTCSTLPRSGISDCNILDMFDLQCISAMMREYSPRESFHMLVGFLFSIQIFSFGFCVWLACLGSIQHFELEVYPRVFSNGPMRQSSQFSLVNIWPTRHIRSL